MSDITGPKSIAITDAVAVLPDRVLEHASVGLRDGRIAEVNEGGGFAGRYETRIDVAGAYLLPGIIDVHNDSLETEVNPRPNTNLPVEFALANLECRLLSSGVTAVFHAISFMNNPRSNRTVEAAAERAASILAYQQTGESLIDHHVLHRLDVWSPGHLDTLYGSLDRMPLRYVSINDHTPGQGQYRDLDRYKVQIAAWTAQRGGRLDIEGAMQRMHDRAADTETIPAVYARIRAEQSHRPYYIASHDDDSPEKVEVLHEIGATVTEFPVTLEAARRARDLGMTIVVGAPNIVRGGSSSGNLDAALLFQEGLADVICADYHAPSLLPAAFRLVDDGVIDLPLAVRALSLNAARALGHDDLGAVLPGYVADLILVRRRGSVPVVEGVIKGGRRRLQINPRGRVGVPA